MIILLTGKSGQLGAELQAPLDTIGRVVAIDREEMDFCDAEAIRRVVREISPDIVINAAGYTLVDRAESDPQPSRLINAEACGMLAQLAYSQGFPLVHFSTDYVFDGSGARPYGPQDAPGPLNAYGRDKLAGEIAIRQSGCAHLILRTSWLYGFHGQNFLLTMLKLAQTQTHINVVNDQVGSPTWSRTLALSTVSILQFMLDHGGVKHAFARLGGTYHLTSLGETSWYGFAREIFRLASLPRPLIVAPVLTAQFPRPARRPAYSVLDCTRTEEAFSISLPHWADALRDAFASQQTLPPLLDSVA